MLFNSPAYLLFLPIVFLLYWFVFNKRVGTQNLLILFASYVFYAWWSWKFMLLLILSTVLDYCYGFGVASTNRKKSRTFLWLSIINNLGILGIFKYYNFFVTEFQHALGTFHIQFSPILLQVALPVGISFYTFHGMSYVFDIYRGIRQPVHRFVDYAVFVCFFPLLVAGPIERANHLLPQVQSKRVFSYSQAIEGCKLLIWGLFKKIVIADSIAVNVNFIFDNYSTQNAVGLLIGAIGFSFQIYADFSGYTDIALGSAKLLGFELLTNFRFPYFSRDIAEFWRRWHISLSSWFRDYLYIPLGGSKNGKALAVRNIFIIFLVSGFWHGASWNFLVWGGIHACGFLPLLLLNKNRTHVLEGVAAHKRLPSSKEFWQMTSTFAFVTLAWIFFRIHDLRDGLNYIRRIVINSIQHPGQYLNKPEGLSIFLYILPLVIFDWHLRRDERKLALTKPILIILCLLIVNFLLYQILDDRKSEFIYFNF